MIAYAEQIGLQIPRRVHSEVTDIGGGILILCRISVSANMSRFMPRGRGRGSAEQPIDGVVWSVVPSVSES
jgi:hypothetical protein